MAGCDLDAPIFEGVDEIDLAEHGILHRQGRKSYCPRTQNFHWEASAPARQVSPANVDDYLTGSRYDYATNHLSLSRRPSDRFLRHSILESSLHSIPLAPAPRSLRFSSFSTLQILKREWELAVLESLHISSPPEGLMETEPPVNAYLGDSMMVVRLNVFLGELHKFFGH